MPTEDDRIQDAVRAGGLLVAGRPVLVMLSGGRDSVCLLDLAVRLAGAGVVRALHVNYGLRDAARADEEHCAALCERLGVALEVVRPQRPEARGNLQAWARDARYGAAARLALERRALVAAGHTATDQAETVLYRLASSPGRRALLGMRPRDGRLIRPLLAVSREATAAYCRARGLTWREDASNTSCEFARNRVRHELLPALRAIHPAAEANVLRTAQLLRDEAAVLDELVDGLLDAGGRSISLARLRAQPPALRRLIVQRLADGAAGDLVPGAARRADEIARLSQRGTAALDLPVVRALVKDGTLRMRLRDAPRPKRSKSTTRPRPRARAKPPSATLDGP